MNSGTENPNTDATKWKYLEQRRNSWRKQLYVKGRAFKALDVYEEILATDETAEEASKAWNLPIEAIEEIAEYCKQNQELLKKESHVDNIRIESIYRLSSSARHAFKCVFYGVLALLPVILVFSSKDWIFYVVCTLLFVIFLRFAKEIPVLGSFWISSFGDNSVFEWLKVTVIPVSVLILGTSIASAINSRQSEANIEKSRYDITQNYFDLFNPNNQSALAINRLKAEVYAQAPKVAERTNNRNRLYHLNGSYKMATRCFAFPQSSWLSNQTILALNQLTGLQTNWSTKTAQKRYILELLQKEGLLKVEQNVISLRYADLSDSNLVLVDMSNSCLESVLFSDYAATPRSRSDLRHATFDNSDLTGANMKNANLRGASLRGVDLRGFASLRNSDLRGADLSNALIDGTTQLTGATINTSFLDIGSHKKSWVYSMICFSGLRSYLKRTYYCLDSIDYKNLLATKLPKECTSSGCRQLTLEETKKKGVIVDNRLPFE